jgi:hypothetical protein
MPPPELMAGEGLASGTDIFELGMLLHEWLTGAVPPRAISRLMGHRNWPPPLSRTLGWFGQLCPAARGD